MKQCILLLEHKDYNPEALHILKEIGSVGFYDPSDGPDRYEQITIIISRLAYYLDRTFLWKFPMIKVIATPTTGLNHCDLNYCNSHGIKIISLRGESDFLRQVTATAELSFALMLNLVRAIPASIASVVHDHKWNRDKFRGRELKSLTLGILGFGRLGRQMAFYAKTFGMSVLASDPSIQLSVLESCQVTGCSKKELFEQSDIVSLHVNYDETNHNLVSTDEFSAMKLGSYFVNTSRGELVDETALLKALSTKHLAGAALDVLADEQNLPALFDKELIKYARTHRNLLITPHTGGCTLDSMHKTEMFIAKKLKRLIEARK